MYVLPASQDSTKTGWAGRQLFHVPVSRINSEFTGALNSKFKPMMK